MSLSGDARFLSWGVHLEPFDSLDRLRYLLFFDIRNHKLLLINHETQQPSSYDFSCVAHCQSSNNDDTLLVLDLDNTKQAYTVHFYFDSEFDRDSCYKLLISIINQNFLQIAKQFGLTADLEIGCQIQIIQKKLDTQDDDEDDDDDDDDDENNIAMPQQQQSNDILQRNNTNNKESAKNKPDRNSKGTNTNRGNAGNEDKKVITTTSEWKPRVLSLIQNRILFFRDKTVDYHPLCMLSLNHASFRYYMTDLYDHTVQLWFSDNLMYQIHLGDQSAVNALNGKIRAALSFYNQYGLNRFHPDQVAPRRLLADINADFASSADECETREASPIAPPLPMTKTATPSKHPLLKERKNESIKSKLRSPSATTRTEYTEPNAKQTVEAVLKAHAYLQQSDSDQESADSSETDCPSPDDEDDDEEEDDLAMHVAVAIDQDEEEESNDDDDARMMKPQTTAGGDLPNMDIFVFRRKSKKLQSKPLPPRPISTTAAAMPSTVSVKLNASQLSPISPSHDRRNSEPDYGAIFSGNRYSQHTHHFSNQTECKLQQPVSPICDDDTVINDPSTAGGLTPNSGGGTPKLLRQSLEQAFDPSRSADDASKKSQPPICIVRNQSRNLSVTEPEALRRRSMRRFDSNIAGGPTSTGMEEEEEQQEQRMELKADSPMLMGLIADLYKQHHVDHEQQQQLPQQREVPSKHEKRTSKKKKNKKKKQVVVMLNQKRKSKEHVQQRQRDPVCNVPECGCASFSAATGWNIGNCANCGHDEQEHYEFHLRFKRKRVSHDPENDEHDKCKRNKQNVHKHTNTNCKKKTKSAKQLQAEAKRRSALVVGHQKDIQKAKEKTTPKRASASSTFPRRPITPIQITDELNAVQVPIHTKKKKRDKKKTSKTPTTHCKRKHRHRHHHHHHHHHHRRCRRKTTPGNEENDGQHDNNDNDDDNEYYYDYEDDEIEDDADNNKHRMKLPKLSAISVSEPNHPPSPSPKQARKSTTQKRFSKQTPKEKLTIEVQPAMDMSRLAPNVATGQLSPDRTTNASTPQPLSPVTAFNGSQLSPLSPNVPNQVSTLQLNIHNDVYANPDKQRSKSTGNVVRPAKQPNRYAQRQSLNPQPIYQDMQAPSQQGHFLTLNYMERHQSAQHPSSSQQLLPANMPIMQHSSSYMEPYHAMRGYSSSYATTPSPLIQSPQQPIPAPVASPNMYYQSNQFPYMPSYQHQQQGMPPMYHQATPPPGGNPAYMPFMSNIPPPPIDIMDGNNTANPNHVHTPNTPNTPETPMTPSAQQRGKENTKRLKPLKWVKPLKKDKSKISTFIWGKANPSSMFPAYAYPLTPWNCDHLSQKQIHSISVAKEGGHCLGIGGNDRCFVWGQAKHAGVLGLGTNSMATSPCLLTALRKVKVKQACCSALHSLCITDNQVIYGWGNKKLTLLGMDTNEPVPLQFLNGKGLTTLAACNTHSVAYNPKDIHVYSFGEAGPWLGFDDDSKKCSMQKATFGCIKFDSFIYQNQFVISSVQCSSEYTLILLNTGFVGCCGVNEHGRMAIGQKLEQSAKVLWNKNLQKIVRISAGKYHSGYVDTKGRVYTAGYGKDHRLGHGDIETLYLPKIVEAVQNVPIREIECVAERTYVVSTAGHLILWGKEPITKRTHYMPFIYNNLNSYRVFNVCGANDFCMVQAMPSKQPLQLPDIDGVQQSETPKAKKLPALDDHERAQHSNQSQATHHQQHQRGHQGSNRMSTISTLSKISNLSNIPNMPVTPPPSITPHAHERNSLQSQTQRTSLAFTSTANNKPNLQRFSHSHTPHRKNPEHHEYDNDGRKIEYSRYSQYMYKKKSADTRSYTGRYYNDTLKRLNLRDHASLNTADFRNSNKQKCSGHESRNTSIAFHRAQTDTVKPSRNCTIKLQRADTDGCRSRSNGSKLQTNRARQISLMCSHAGCYCEQFVKSSSKWSKGKCKRCHHKEKEHNKMVTEIKLDNVNDNNYQRYFHR